MSDPIPPTETEPAVIAPTVTPSAEVPDVPAPKPNAVPASSAPLPAGIEEIKKSTAAIQ